MAKIKWSKDALFALKDICDYIALDSKFYARIFSDRVIELVEHLETFPEIGRKVPEADDLKVREIIYKNYRIIYQLLDGYIEIITILSSPSESLVEDSDDRNLHAF